MDEFLGSSVPKNGHSSWMSGDNKTCPVFGRGDDELKNIGERKTGI